VLALRQFGVRTVVKEHAELDLQDAMWIHGEFHRLEGDGVQQIELHADHAVVVELLEDVHDVVQCTRVCGPLLMVEVFEHRHQLVAVVVELERDLEDGVVDQVY